MPEIAARGAELVVVGNGDARFAAAFREDTGYDGALLVDPELRAYRAAGLRRGRVEALSPRLGLNAWRALRAGYRQTSVEGDPWQLGGVLVLRPDGSTAYRQASREAGDHADLTEVLAALEPGAPAVAEEEAPSPWLRLASRVLALGADATVAFSFDRVGYALHAVAFDPDDLAVDLGGRRALVTGANSGIGYETALALADLGAEVRLGCRDRERGEAAAERIRDVTGNRSVAVERVDVADAASVEALVARLAAEPLDVLVHNAGVLPDTRIETRDGLELCFATHVAGPHRLTRGLRPALERAPDARVVFVSSGGMYLRRLALDDPQWERRAYDGVLAYADTKRMQVVLAEQWALRLARTRVVVNAMHPGWAATPSVARSLPRFQRWLGERLRTPAEGADTVVWLAAAEAARDHSGEFFFDRAPRSPHWLPWTRESGDERKELMRLCDRLARRAPAAAEEPA